MDRSMERRERLNRLCMNGWAILQLLAGFGPIIWFLQEHRISPGSWVSVYFPCLVLIGTGIVGILSNVNRIQTNLDGTYLALNVVVLLYLFVQILRTVILWAIRAQVRIDDDQWSLENALLITTIIVLLPYTLVVTVPSTVLSCIRVCRKNNDVSSPPGYVSYTLAASHAPTGVDQIPQGQLDGQSQVHKTIGHVVQTAKNVFPFNGCGWCNIILPILQIHIGLGLIGQSIAFTIMLTTVLDFFFMGGLSVSAGVIGVFLNRTHQKWKTLTGPYIALNAVLILGSVVEGSWLIVAANKLHPLENQAVIYLPLVLLWLSLFVAVPATVLLGKRNCSREALVVAESASYEHA